MSVEVRLLGTPQIRGGDETSQPRGRKSWALLARLVLASRPMGRAELTQVLFVRAADPAAALRWSLAELRKSLGRSDLLKGDPVTLRADAELDIDVLRLESEDASLADLDGELLHGVEPEGCPDFSVWLTIERHRLRARLENALRDRAHRHAATGDWATALELAGRAVNLNPLCEPLQELFVRSLAMTGDVVGAEAQFERCRELFVRELGEEPSPALRIAAARRAEPRVERTPPAHKAAIQSLLEAGQAAVDAGAVDAGIDTLRRSLAQAKRLPDPALGARCGLALGGALVHALRGHHEEGAELLHEASVMARRSGQRSVAADALRELGFVDVQAGRREQAGRVLDEAAELASEDDQAMSAILGVRGMNLSDYGDYDGAHLALSESVERADACGKRRQAAWSMSLLARIHAVRGERAEALELVESCLELVARERWTAFAPWPRAVKAELLMSLGETCDGELMESLHGTFALACQVADPCWEGVAARAMALLCARGGDDEGAARWLGEAWSRCTRGVDQYVWILAYVLDARCQLQLAAGERDETLATAEQMAELSARTEQREHLARALSYQARAGKETARARAIAVAREVDNDALHAWVRER